MKKSKILKRGLSVALAAACASSCALVSASAATEFVPVYPTEPMAVESKDGPRVMTTTAQRASSEIPLILGLNVIAGNLFDGNLVMGGTNVNDNPDPYIWNYNYMFPANQVEGGTSNSGEAAADLPESERYVVISSGTGGNGVNGGMANGNGLYSSGGANQIYSTGLEEYGGLSYGVYHTIDAWIGFNSDVVDQINYIKNEMDKTSEYYQAAFADYDPLITDCGTGTVVSRAYAWVEMGNALSAYLATHPDVTTRYGDPQALCYNIQEYAFGIPYYIDSLIADGTLTQIKGAYITATSDDGLTFTVQVPGRLGDVQSDCYAVGSTVNWLEGDYTMDQLKAEGIGVLVIGASGYAYTTSSGGVAGPGGAQGGGNKQTATKNLSRAYLEGLMEEVGYTAETAPVIVDAANESVTPGTNGYNYAPTTPLFVPYITAYMYLDQLSALADAGDEIAAAVNPAGLFEFMMDEFLHIEDGSTKNMTQYYIGVKWDPTDSDLDKVPDSASYIYDKNAIIEAIQQGIQFSLNNQDDESIYLIGAYRQGENGYLLATALEESGKDTFADLIPAADKDGKIVVADVDITALVSYYGVDGLAALVDDYAAHMVDHAWVPDTTVVGTYGYGLAPQVFTDLDEENGAWYIDAVQWAVALGITNGLGDETTFGPNASCTRAQVVTFLWRAAGCPEPATSTNDFTDLDEKNGSWYIDAVQWAVEQGITNGMTETTFEPDTTCTRAQIVTFLYRFENTPDAGANNVFTDVAADAYYADAVAWALENGITNGMTDTTFVPDFTCTRAQVVTFLYRDIA